MENMGRKVEGSNSLADNLYDAINKRAAEDGDSITSDILLEVIEAVIDRSTVAFTEKNIKLFENFNFKIFFKDNSVLEVEYDEEEITLQAGYYIRAPKGKIAVNTDDTGRKPS